MSYLDVFKKKLTVFADKLVAKRSDKCCKVKEVRWSNAPAYSVTRPMNGSEAAGFRTSLFLSCKLCCCDAN